MSEHLGEFEQLVLLAVLRLEDRAYGVSIRQEIETRAGRGVSYGALYTTLERLERKGYVSSRVGEPSAVRGGRCKKFYLLEAGGEAALSRAYAVMRRMTEGLEPRLEAFERGTVRHEVPCPSG